MIERDDKLEALPGEVAGDHLTAVIAELIAVVFETFPETKSAEHREAMCAVLDLHQRLRAGRSRPRLN
jgi:hypothetical protein